MRKLLIAVAALMALSGCAVYPVDSGYGPVGPGYGPGYGYGPPVVVIGGPWWGGGRWGGGRRLHR
jgi:hypothetical protein